MKRVLILAACAVLCSTAAWADNGLGIFGSTWSPSDGSGTFGPGAKLSIEMIPSVLLDLRVSYYNDVLDDRDGRDMQVIPIEFGLSATFPVADRFDVYGGGGAGVYMFDGSAPDDDSAFGFYLAGGVEFILNDSGAVYGATRSTLFAEAMYRQATVDDSRGGDIELGGPVLNVGLMIRW